MTETVNIQDNRRNSITKGNATGVVLMSLLAFSFLVLLFTSCKHEINVNESTDFEVSNMPYYKDIVINQTVEVRMELSTENKYEGTKYTVRYFPYSGTGRLRIGAIGQTLSPNDRYDIKTGAFRVYYTPVTSGNHSLELVFEDNHGNAQTVILDFNANALEEEGGTQGSEEVPSDRGGIDFELGKPYIGPNGNWFIDGQDTGISSGIAEERLNPEVSIENGNYYVNGQDSGVKAPNEDPVTVGIDEEGYFTIDGVKTDLKAPDAPQMPDVGVTGDGEYYTLDNVPTEIPYADTEVEADYTNPENLIDVTSTLSAYEGKPQVLLVSKGGKVTNTLNNEEIEYAGVLLEDGSATYRVYDQNDRPAGFAIVRDMPNLKGQVFTADKDGFFNVKRDLLPKSSDNLPKYCSVSIGGKNFTTEETTVVPAQMVISLMYSHKADKGYYFAFTQADSNNENLTLPITIEGSEKWFNPDNLVILTETYSNGVLGMSRSWYPDVVDPDRASVEGGYLRVESDLVLFDRPDTAKTRIYYLTIALKKAPYGAKIVKSFMLGFFPMTLLGPAPQF